MSTPRTTAPTDGAASRTSTGRRTTGRLRADESADSGFSPFPTAALRPKTGGRERAWGRRRGSCALGPRSRPNRSDWPRCVTRNDTAIADRAQASRRSIPRWSRRWKRVARAGGDGLRSSDFGDTPNGPRVAPCAGELVGLPEGRERRQPDHGRSLTRFAATQSESARADSVVASCQLLAAPSPA